MTQSRRIATRLSTAALLGVVASGGVMPAERAPAAVLQWVSATSAFFDIETQWDSGSRPGIDDTAQFNLAGTYNVLWDLTTQNLAPTVDQLQVTNGVINFRNNSTANRWAMNLAGATPSQSNFSVSGGSTVLQINGLEYTTPGAELLGGATMSLEAAAPQFSLLNIGSEGLTVDGNLNILQGSIIDVAVGSSVGSGIGTAGAAAVSGVDSTWHNAGTLIVGGLGSGTVDVLGSADLISDAGEIGAQAGGIGVVNINGASSDWTMPGTLIVGKAGQGTLNIDNGGAVTASGNTFVGQDSGVTGAINIDGANAVLDTPELYVGESGSGTVLVENSGAILSSDAWIGNSATAISSVTIHGDGSNWSNSGGELYVGNGGDGTLNVQAGGGVGTLDLRIAQLPLSIGQATVTGSAGANDSLLDVTQALYVGVSGSGVLNILDGGDVAFGEIWIAHQADSVGQVTVSGSGSLLDGGAIDIGSAAEGSLLVDSGASALTEDAYIAREEAAVGSATVSGAGTQWINANDLYLGLLGSASLDVDSGGAVEVSGNTQVAAGAGSTGIATVSGAGSAWSTAGSLDIGRGGDGTLTVVGGGVVSASSVQMGVDPGSVGVVDVADSGSALNIAGALAVGQSGMATLDIGVGGSVSVGGTTSIGINSAINLNGGTLDFGTTSLSQFNQINDVSGTLIGNVTSDQVVDAATLTDLMNPAVDTSAVTYVNSGLLFGNAHLNAALQNSAAGEVETVIGERMHFTGAGNTNAGTINNYGGQIRFDQDATNLDGGTIQGRGRFVFQGGWTNAGDANFSGGFADIQGDTTITPTGSVITTGGAVTTFFDALVHNGVEIRTAPGSHTVVFGQASGAGTFTDAGSVRFEGGYTPGNSPAVVSFEGDLSFGDDNTLTIELAGTTAGTYDKLVVTASLTLDGDLDVVLIDDFAPSAGDVFDLFDFAQLNATFDAVNLPTLGTGLAWDTAALYSEGSISVASTLPPGDTDGDGDVDDSDLGTSFSNYTGPIGAAGNRTPAQGDTDGDGDIDDSDLGTSFTNYTGPLVPANVPEPMSLALLGFCGLGLLSHRRAGRRV